MMPYSPIQYLSLLFLLYSSVDGHSWPENPRPRQYRWAIEGGCVEDETGKVVRRCTFDKNSIRITLITCIHTHTHSFFFFFFFSLSLLSCMGVVHSTRSAARTRTASTSRTSAG